MAIKNNKTVCGKDIKNIAKYSHIKIIRICDLCKKEDKISFSIYSQQKDRRVKRGVVDKDVCYKCRYKIFPPAGKGKPMPMAQRKILSDKAKERNKDAKYKKVVNGYAIRYELGKTIFIHRDNYEKYNNIKLNKDDVIHHINLDSLDNSPDNLIALKFDEHTKKHRDLEKLAGDLIRRGIIKFSKQDKKYYIDHGFDLATMPLSLNFKDVAIQQSYNICKSRLDTNISSEIIKGVVRKIPIIASNMSTVINSDFYIKLYELGAFAIMHRATTEDHIISEIKKISEKCEWVAASVGVTDNDFDLSKRLIRHGANIICIDIAHGLCKNSFDMAKKIKNFSKKIKIIIGNTTNTDIFCHGLRYIDCIKVGIANGLVCESKNTAGCNEGQFSSVYKFKQISRDLGIPIISDGGIREPADFTKAIAAGSSSVMAGSIFAKCPESAAEIIKIDNSFKKLYAGMASRYVQEKWKNGLKPGTCPEGKVVYLDIGESVEKLLERYCGALRSGITYSGANDILSFQDKVKFVRIINRE